jgi:hypothetical protein
MKTEEIIACLEITGAEAIHSLTVLAAHIDRLDDRSTDAELVSGAARDIACVVISIREQLLPGFHGLDLVAKSTTTM